ECAALKTCGCGGNAHVPCPRFTPPTTWILRVTARISDCRVSRALRVKRSHIMLSIGLVRGRERAGGSSGPGRGTGRGNGQAPGNFDHIRLTEKQPPKALLMVTDD